MELRATAACLPEEAMDLAVRDREIRASVDAYIVAHQHIDPRTVGMLKMFLGWEDGRGHSKVEVAAAFGVGPERVRQVMKWWRRKLREVRGGVNDYVSVHPPRQPVMYACAPPRSPYLIPEQCRTCRWRQAEESYGNICVPPSWRDAWLKAGGIPGLFIERQQVDQLNPQGDCVHYEATRS
jgi:hypothetical protein